jgi:hypothetical protein
MIHRLRQHHGRMLIALGIFLPVMFAIGICARKPMPKTTELPPTLAATTQTFEAVFWKNADVFAKAPIQVRLLREQQGAGRFAISFSSAQDFAKPDLIVYWVTGSPSITNTLPDDAILLGTCNTTALPLPDDVAKSSGALVLYSLADNEIVDVSKLIRFNDFTNR